MQGERIIAGDYDGKDNLRKGMSTEVQLLFTSYYTVMYQDSSSIYITSMHV
jgi:hypothetical protein